MRTFTSHGAQLACVAVRPLYANHVELSKPDVQSSSQLSSGTTLVDSSSGFGGSQAYASQPADSDAKSDASFDPLFDDEEEAETSGTAPPKPTQFVGSGQKPALPNAAPPRAIAPPKNAPPLLDAATCGALSADVLMTASIDGQVILWDKRAHTPGTGVGRLWMSEKTPPWCLSVSSGCCFACRADPVMYAFRRAGPRTVGSSMRGGETGRLTCGTRAS